MTLLTRLSRGAPRFLHVLLLAGSFFPLLFLSRSRDTSTAVLVRLEPTDRERKILVSAGSITPAGLPTTATTGAATVYLPLFDDEHDQAMDTKPLPEEAIVVSSHNNNTNNEETPTEATILCSISFYRSPSSIKDKHESPKCALEDLMDWRSTNTAATPISMNATQWRLFREDQSSSLSSSSGSWTSLPWRRTVDVCIDLTHPGRTNSRDSSDYSSYSLSTTTANILKEILPHNATHVQLHCRCGWTIQQTIQQYYSTSSKLTTNGSTESHDGLQFIALVLVVLLLLLLVIVSTWRAITILGMRMVRCQERREESSSSSQTTKYRIITWNLGGDDHDNYDNDQVDGQERLFHFQTLQLGKDYHEKLILVS